MGIKIIIESPLKDKITAEYLGCYMERIRGLMFRKKGNALLDFKKEGKYGIWMMGMRFPLRIFFLDKKMRVVGIKHAQPITINPKTWRIYSCETPYRFVLEVDARENFSLKVGERVRILFV